MGCRSHSLRPSEPTGVILTRGRCRSAALAGGVGRNVRWHMAGRRRQAGSQSRPPGNRVGPGLRPDRRARTKVSLLMRDDPAPGFKASPAASSGTRIPLGAPGSPGASALPQTPQACRSDRERPSERQHPQIRTPNHARSQTCWRSTAKTSTSFPPPRRTPSSASATWALPRPTSRFALLMNRFAWEEDGKTRQRKRAALHFDRVNDVKVQGIDTQRRRGRARAARHPLHRHRRSGRHRRSRFRRRRHRPAHRRSASRRACRISAPPGPPRPRRSTPPDAVPPRQPPRRLRRGIRNPARVPSARSPRKSAAPSPPSSTTCKARGDEAVLAYTDRFDQLPLTAATLAFSADEIDAADAAHLRRGARRAAVRARPHHARITKSRSRSTTSTRTRSASPSAPCGRRSRPSASTCPAAPRPIRRRC